MCSADFEMNLQQISEVTLFDITLCFLLAKQIFLQQANNFFLLHSRSCTECDCSENLLESVNLIGLELNLKEIGRVNVAHAYSSEE